MTGIEIRKQIQSIMRMKMAESNRLDILTGFVAQQQREAFATGKAEAYKEMFSVIRKLAGEEKTEQAIETQPGRAGG